MNKMEDKKRIGLIVTLVTTLLCACPGLIAVLIGAGVSFSGGTQSNLGLAVAIAFICIGVVLVLIPVTAGIYTWMQSRRSVQLEDLEVPPPL